MAEAARRSHIIHMAMHHVSTRQQEHSALQGWGPKACPGPGRGRLDDWPFTTQAPLRYLGSTTVTCAWVMRNGSCVAAAGRFGAWVVAIFVHRCLAMHHPGTKAHAQLHGHAPWRLAMHHATVAKGFWWCLFGAPPGTQSNFHYQIVILPCMHFRKDGNVVPGSCVPMHILLRCDFSLRICPMCPIAY
jgi:hypothetical protein